MRFNLLFLFTGLFFMVSCTDYGDIGTIETENQAFINEYALQSGVKSTESGLLYRVIEEGGGTEMDENGCVLFHYIGSIPDGTVIQNTYDSGEPIRYLPSRLPIGIFEGFMLMREGDRYELVVPPELGIVDFASHPDIPPMSIIILEIELLEVTFESGVCP